MELSDGDIPPDDFREWALKILDLAGWIVDLALLLENKKGNGVIGERELWLMQNAIEHYHESLEELKVIEQKVDW